MPCPRISYTVGLVLNPSYVQIMLVAGPLAYLNANNNDESDINKQIRLPFIRVRFVPPL